VVACRNSCFVIIKVWKLRDDQTRPKLMARLLCHWHRRGPSLLLPAPPSSRRYEYHQPNTPSNAFVAEQTIEPKMSQYSTNERANFSNNENCFNVWNNYTTADDRSHLLAWLSPLDPGLRHCDIQDRRVDDVGEWLMGTDEFRRWCGLGGEGESHEAVLFCYGNLGVGKTFIR